MMVKAFFYAFKYFVNGFFDVLTLIGGKLAGLLTCIGISPEHQSSIFERLYRVDKIKRCNIVSDVTPFFICRYYV